MKAVIVFVFVFISFCAAEAARNEVQARMRFPAFGGALRLGTHTEPLSLKKCYGQYTVMLMCPLIEEAKKAQLAKNPKQQFDSTQFALQVTQYLRNAGLRVNLQRLDEILKEGTCTNEAGYHMTQPLKFTYAMLRSLSKTEFTWDAWFDGAPDAKHQHQLDQYMVMLAYNILSTGFYKAGIATTDAAAADLTTAYMNGKLKKGLQKFQEEDGNLKHHNVLFDSQQFRAHLDNLIKDDFVRFPDCKRVAFTMKSMSIGGDLLGEEAKKKAQLIKTISGVFNTLLGGAAGLAAGAFGGPAAGAAASATVGIVGKLVDTFVDSKLGSELQKLGVFQVVNTYFDALIQPDPRESEVEMKGNAILAKLNIMSDKIGSLENQVSGLLHPKQQGNGNFRSMRFRSKGIEYKSYDQDTILDEKLACTKAQAANGDCKCTSKVKTALAILRDMFENPIASGGRSLITAMEACAPKSFSRKWFSSDYADADHAFSVKAMFKLSETFMKMPEGYEAVQVNTGTLKRLYDGGILQDLAAKGVDIGTKAYEQAKTKADKQEAYAKEILKKAKELNPGKDIATLSAQEITAAKTAVDNAAKKEEKAVETIQKQIG